VAFSTHKTVANHAVIFHDLQHRQARDTRYKFCNWVERYDCTKGSTVARGLPIFGGAEPGSSSDDTVQSAVWVDLPDNHGVIYFGQLASTPAGYTAPGDPDGLTHQWYGSSQDQTNPTGKPGHCCHAQDDPWWQATGPAVHYRLAKGWIYNPNDLIAPARGKADLWSRTPSSEFEMGTILPLAAQRTPPGFFRNAYFDAPTRRIYVVLHEAEKTIRDGEEGKRRPAIAVLEVK